MISRYVLTIALLAFSGAAIAQSADPLPSWHDGKTKQDIIAFVNKTTATGSASLVPAEQRIAVFDMDGTLVPEKPLPGAAVSLVADIKIAVARHPELKKKPAIAALLAGDVRGVQATGKAGLADIVAAGIDGRTVDEVAKDMLENEQATQNPHFKKPYAQLAYLPMLELFKLLREHGFQIWICSGSPVAYTRALSQDEFGVPPAQVIGSSMQTRFAYVGDRTELVYTGAIERVNDKEGKPPAINLAIGQRPVFVGGNVGGEGDIAMMRYSRDRSGPSFQLLINHDDATREFAYQEKTPVSLDAAARYGFHVVSMAHDWSTIFSSQPASAGASSIRQQEKEHGYSEGK